MTGGQRDMDNLIESRVQGNARGMTQCHLSATRFAGKQTDAAQLQQMLEPYFGLDLSTGTEQRGGLQSIGTGNVSWQNREADACLGLILQSSGDMNLNTEWKSAVLDECRRPFHDHCLIRRRGEEVSSLPELSR